MASMRLDSPWPRDRDALIAVAQGMLDPQRVGINQAAIEQLPLGEITAPQPGQISLAQPAVNRSLDEAAQFHIALNAINHLFWSVDGEGAFVRYTHEGHVGALAMSAAFQKAWSDPQSPLQKARAKGPKLKVPDIHAMFGPIPDPAGRARILNEVLKGPELAVWGHRSEVAAMWCQSAAFTTTMAAGLADSFPLAFGDPLLKKAQLAVSNIWREAKFRGFDRLCKLTAFADYQIPNVLRAMGLLDYAPDLAAHIDAGRLIVAESPDEHAIRGASILAIEALAQVQHVHVADVDHWIWLRRHVPLTPFHRTITTAY
jgi:hypothetical protein